MVCVAVFYKMLTIPPPFKQQHRFLIAVRVTPLSNSQPMDANMTRIVLPAALLLAACALGACSSMTGTKTLAATGTYHPKYLPAAEVFAASEKSGRFGGATYVCGDRNCATAVRAD